jgi:nucleoside diphosphate kinase
MAIERTFSILNPDATERNLTGAINAVIEKSGLRIVAQKRMRICREQAEKLYLVHRERPFFRELVESIMSGPVVVQVSVANLCMMIAGKGELWGPHMKSSITKRSVSLEDAFWNDLKEIADNQQTTLSS